MLGRAFFGLALLALRVKAGDINRQSIVYHEETPEVFYCPQVWSLNKFYSVDFSKLRIGVK